MGAKGEPNGASVYFLTVISSNDKLLSSNLFMNLIVYSIFNSFTRFIRSNS